MRTLLLMAIALFTYVIDVHGQLTGRVEHSTKDDYEDENVFSLKEQGMLMVSFHKKSENGKRWVKFELFDTDLKLKGVDSLQVDKGMYVYTSKYENKKNYLILRESGGEFAVLVYDPATRKITVTDGEYTRKGSMRDITIDKDMVVFSSTQKRLDRIGIINLKTGESRFADMHFEGVRDRKVFILENTVIDNIIYTLVKVDKALYLVRIDMQGNQLGETLLADGEEAMILQASISKAGKNFFVTGTYTKKKKGLAQGIYFAELDNWKFKYVNYYNFLDLSNFTEYMSEKRQKKIERKKEKAEAKGKELLLNYNMASHDIITDGKDYYYLGEAYYPTYTTTYVGNTMTTRFDGYAYTHAVLVKFDKSGKLLWDVCFPMKPTFKPFYVKRFVSSAMESNNVHLLYADKKTFVSKLFSNADGAVLKDRNVEQIDTDKENEKIKRPKPANSQHWFDNHFLVYGTQIVKNTDTGDRRKVVYVNKYTIK